VRNAAGERLDELAESRASLRPRGAVSGLADGRYYALAVLSHRLGLAQRFKLVAVVAAELLFTLSQVSVLTERAIRPQFHALDGGSNAFGEFVGGQLGGGQHQFVKTLVFNLYV
jgi:hypothetical protein